MTRAEFIERLKKLIEEAENDGRTEKSSQNVSNDDLISRKAAIDEIKALYEWHEIVTEDRAIDHFKRLPSAQPKIIRCRDCKHWDGVDTCDVIGAPVWDNDFCSMAERRTDE